MLFDLTETKDVVAVASSASSETDTNAHPASPAIPPLPNVLSATTSAPAILAECRFDLSRRIFRIRFSAPTMSLVCPYVEGPLEPPRLIPEIAL